MHRSIAFSGVPEVAGLLAFSTKKSRDDEDGQPPLFLSNVDIDVPPQAQFDITATVEQRRITTTETASFDLTLERTGRETKPLNFDFVYPFNTVPRSADPPGVCLVPVKYGAFRRSSRMWLLEWDELTDLETELPRVRKQLSPDESVTGRWEIWSDPDTAPSIKSGTYAFADEIQRASDSDGTATENHPWKLTLTIEEMD